MASTGQILTGYAPPQTIGDVPQVRGSVSSSRGGLSPSIVEYTPPAYDEEQVQAFQQEMLAPSLGALRRSMREMHAGRYAGPSARREALRGAVRGYGEALAPLQVGAGAQARQRYDIQYQQAILAEQHRVAAEERAAERELKGGSSTRRAGISVAAPASGMRGPGFQPWDPRFQEAAPTRIVGLTEASRRPIYDPYAGYASPLQEQPAGTTSGTDYPENWMT